MEIKINKDGMLEINEIGKSCPYDKRGMWCGDWCALFGEPRTRRRSEKGLFIVLALCHTSWTCEPEDFTDEREVPDEDS